MENIYFVSMMRSGHHAVLNWFARNQFQPIKHLNDCRMVSGEIIQDPPDLLMYYNGLENRYLLHESQQVKEEILSDCQKTIYSFEERDLKYIEDASNIIYPEKIIYVVRDPLNFIASCLKHAEKYPNVEEKLVGQMTRRLSIWKTHARMLEGKQNSLHGAINYNLWFACKEYRDSLAEHHGFDNRDIGFDEVMLFGQGSSFDDLRYASKAAEMQVLNRWEAYRDDPLFCSFISEELTDIAARLFDIHYS